VAVRRRGRGGNRIRIGAKVTISAGGTKQVREIRSGGSFLSQNDLRAFSGSAIMQVPSTWIRMPGGAAGMEAAAANAFHVSRSPNSGNARNRLKALGSRLWL